jgi:microcystin-dependent protein
MSASGGLSQGHEPNARLPHNPRRRFDSRMADPFLGELRLMSFNFPPQGWAMCNGQFLPINQNQALFSLLGTMYGGNGQTTFALPDLRGRVPTHVGAGFTQGQAAGDETHTLSSQEMPAHTHSVNASSSAGDAANPGALAQFSEGYAGPSSLTPLQPSTIMNVGGSQPHENRQPYLVLNWCIALIGIFPSRN